MVGCEPAFGTELKRIREEAWASCCCEVADLACDLVLN
jgi:hypothetical protein